VGGRLRQPGAGGDGGGLPERPDGAPAVPALAQCEAEQAKGDRAGAGLVVGVEQQLGLGAGGVGVAGDDRQGVVHVVQQRCRHGGALP
jgi:hypothetical protein